MANSIELLTMPINFELELGIIEDEFHFVLVCSYFNDARKKYIKPYFYNHPNLHKLIELFTNSSKTSTLKLALFIKESLRIRSSILNDIT